MVKKHRFGSFSANFNLAAVLWAYQYGKTNENKFIERKICYRFISF